jgi:hypothetical protein
MIQAIVNVFDNLLETRQPTTPAAAPDCWPEGNIALGRVGRIFIYFECALCFTSRSYSAHLKGSR